MAGDIYIKTELRAVVIHNDDRDIKALFHKWIERNGRLFGLVEYESGKMDLSPFERVQFCNHTHAEYYFEGV